MICTECNASFDPRHPKQRFCSPRCRYRNRDALPHRREYDRDRHRERREADTAAPTGWHNAKATAAWYGVEYEEFPREEIYERDGWVCGLCGDDIDRTLSWPDPKSASIDHVIPWSRGGAHTRANVQAACLDCNLRKGAANERAAA